MKHKSVSISASALILACAVAVTSAATAQTAKPAAKAGVIPNPDQEEDRRSVVVRIGKSKAGQDMWEVSFLVLPDKATDVRADLGDPALLAKIRQFGGTWVTVETSPENSSRAVEETVRAIARAGFQDISIVGPYAFHGGRFYYYPSTDTGVTEPKLEYDKAQLKRVAAAAGLMNKAIEWHSSRILTLPVFIDETGKPLDVKSGGDSLIPSVRAEVLGTIKVLAPARRGTETVPGVHFIRLDVTSANP